MGEKEYYKFLETLYHKNRDEVYNVMQGSGWSNLPPEQKKKLLNKIRNNYIINEIKSKNLSTK